MSLGNFTGSYEMTVNIDGDNSGMSLGYLIQYSLLPCPAYYPGRPTAPGGGKYQLVMERELDIYLIFL